MPEAFPRRRQQQQQQQPQGPWYDLHQAAIDGSVQRVIALLARGSLDVNQGTRDGKTALMCAAGLGHSSIVRILLNKGADASIADDNGITALLLSAANGHVAATTILAEAGADLQDSDSGGYTPLHMAAQDGHLGVMAALLKAGAEANATTSTGFTPLHMAAQNGHLEVMAALLKAGVDPQATTSHGATPLHLAAQEGRSKVSKALIEAGVDIQATDSNGFTPLHLASTKGRLEVVTVLRTAGADLHAITSAGSTPLYVAAQGGHPVVVRALIDAGVNPNACLPSGSTPLFCAAAGGHVGVVRELLRAKAKPLLAAVNPCSTEIFLPSEMAALRGHVEVVRELVQQLGIKGCCGPSGGARALHLAAEKHHFDVVAVLTDAGVVDTGKALMSSTTYGREAALKLLLQHQDRNGVDTAAYVNAPDELCQTALLCAVGFGRCSPRVVRLLVDAGADTASVLRTTHTPGGHAVPHATPLDLTTHMLQAKKMADGKEATEEQLHGLEGIRRLLLRAEVVHAISWLWPNDTPMISRAAEGTRTGKNTSTPLRMMLPALRRRARRRVVLLGACAGRW